MNAAEPIQTAPLADTPRGVPALLRGCMVLDTVVAADKPPTVSDLARRLDLPKSTVHGLCATLVDLGLLRRRPDNTFRIGPHVMRWANAFTLQTDLTGEFAAFCDSLGPSREETLTLSVLEGRDVVYIGCRNSTAPLGVTFRIGMRLPAPFTATGKALLSTMADEEVRALFDGAWPAPLTARSVRNVEALLGELAACRARGYSIDDGQVREGMHCFGIPVRDASNHVVAGIAVSLLTGKVSAATTRHGLQSIQNMAHALSVRLGAQAAPLSAAIGRDGASE